MLSLCPPFVLPLYAVAGQHAVGIETFGAVGDGKRDNTEAIQKALDFGQE